MKVKPKINSVLPLNELPHDPKSNLIHKKNLSMKLSSPVILGHSEKGTANGNQVISTKRFPKEVFMPPISSHRRVATNETVSLRPFQVERKKPPQCISTAGTVLQSPRVQLMRTLTSHDLNGKIDMPPLISSILSPTSLSASRHKSIQGINLEMAFKSKPLSVLPPRIEIEIGNLVKAKKSTPKNTGSNTNSIRLKPIQRTVHSSQGGTIKILLPRNFVTGDTRPNTKDDDLPKVIVSPSSTKSFIPITEGSSFLDKVIELSRLDSRRNAEVSIRKCNKDKEGEELCNVTFGRSEFQKGIEI